MASMSVLFFCDLCDKPFAKESTRNRHKPYCSRVRSGTKPRRPRACKHCRQAKSRCNFAEPCSTCVGKALRCIYEHGRPRDRQATIPAGRGGQVPMPNDTVVAVTDTAAPELVLPLDLTAAESWHIQDFGNLDIFPTTPVSIDSLSVGNQGSASESFYTLFSASPQPSSVLYLSSPSLLPCFSSPHNHSPFVARKVSAGWRYFLGSSLRSYPLMMLRVDTLPPFIHLQNHQLSQQGNAVLDSTAFESGSNYEDEYHPGDFLANCVAVCQLHSTKTPASDTLFWRVLQGELHAIRQQTPYLTRGQTIAAAQALMVFIIIRLVESGEDYLLNDFSMFDIMRGLHQRFGYLSSSRDAEGAPEDRDMETRWREWVLQESRRRVVVICFLVRLVVSPESFDAIPDINLLVLPADKALWDARSAAAWNYHHTRRGQDGQNPPHEEEPWNRSSSSSSNSYDHFEIKVLGDLAAVQREVLTQHLGREASGSGAMGRVRAGRQLDAWNMRQDGLGVFLSAVAAAAAT